MHIVASLAASPTIFCPPDTLTWKLVPNGAEIMVPGESRPLLATGGSLASSSCAIGGISFVLGLPPRVVRVAPRGFGCSARVSDGQHPSTRMSIIRTQQLARQRKCTERLWGVLGFITP